MTRRGKGPLGGPAVTPYEQHREYVLETLSRRCAWLSPEEREEACARVREIVEELPQRKQAIVKLRFFLHRTPDEIQLSLGISKRAYRRELERAVRFIHERYELVRDGSFCDSRKSVIVAYVRGIVRPDRARDARAPGELPWLRRLGRDAAQPWSRNRPLRCRR